MRPRIVPAVAVLLCAAQSESSAQVLRAAAAVRAVPAGAPLTHLALPGTLSAPGAAAPALPSSVMSLPAPALPSAQSAAPAARALASAMAAQAPALVKDGVAAKAAAGAHFEGARPVVATPSAAPQAAPRLLRPALAALQPASYLSSDMEAAVLRIAAAFDGAAPLPAPDTVEAYRPGAPAEKAEFEAVRARTAARLAAAPRETRKRVAAALDLEFGQILANRAARGLFAEAGDLARDGASPERVAGVLRRAQEFDRDGNLLYAERMPLVMSLRASDPAFRAFSEDLSGIIRAMSRDGSGDGEPRMNWVRKNAVFSAAAEATAGLRVGKALRFLLPDSPPQAAAPAAVRHGFPPFDASALRAAAAAARDKAKFLGAFLGVARDFSRTDLIFDFADTAAVERSPFTATLIARMRENPEVRALMEERRLMPRLDLDRLAALPSDTLGGAYGRYMKKNGFTPDFYKPVDASTDYGWLAVWARQTHDFWHNAAGYTPSNADEIALQAFGMPQFPTAQLPAVIIAAGLLNTARENPGDAAGLLRSIAHAYARGKAARSLAGYRWDLRLKTPLAEVRRELGLPPRADGGPTEAGQDDPRRSPPRRLSRWGALREDLRVMRVLAASGRTFAPRLDAVRTAAARAVRGEAGEDALGLLAAELLRTGLNRPEDLPALMEALAEGALR